MVCAPASGNDVATCSCERRSGSSNRGAGSCSGHRSGDRTSGWPSIDTLGPVLLVGTSVQTGRIMASLTEEFTKRHGKPKFIRLRPLGIERSRVSGKTLDESKVTSQVLSRPPILASPSVFVMSYLKWRPSGVALRRSSVSKRWHPCRHRRFTEQRFSPGASFCCPSSACQLVLHPSCPYRRQRLLPRSSNQLGAVAWCVGGRILPRPRRHPARPFSCCRQPRRAGVTRDAAKFIFVYGVRP